MYQKRSITFIWVFCLLTAAFGIIFLLDYKPLDIQFPIWAIFLSLFLISAFCEYIDSSLGMGYGTTLTPLLLMFGVVRQELVPAILLSELITGLFSGIAHHREGNVNLRENKNIKMALPLLAAPSVIGVVAATLLSSQLKAQGQHYANLYIGTMIVLIGAYLIYSNFFSKSIGIKVSKPKLLVLGTIAAFNKGVSGGGYGPLMTGGQLMSGINEKEAIVITSLCECFTCFVGLIVFYILGGEMNLFYAVPLCMGSMLSVVPAAKTIKLLPEGVLKRAIGWGTLLLGTLTLWKFLH